MVLVASQIRIWQKSCQEVVGLCEEEVRKGRSGGLSRHCCSRPVRLARCTGETSCFHINQLPSLSRRSPVGFIFARSRCCEEIKSPPPAATTNVVCVRTPLALFGVVTLVWPSAEPGHFTPLIPRGGAASTGTCGVVMKLWLLEKNKKIWKVYAFISLYNLFTSPFIILKEKHLELGT